MSGLKEKGVKVSIGLGGWNDSAGDKYGRLILNPAARKKFIVNVIEFMKKYDFQGLDLDYVKLKFKREIALLNIYLFLGISSLYSS